MLWGFRTGTKYDFTFALRHSDLAQLSVHMSLPKMSHALLDFALPWLDIASDSDESIKATLNMAMTCWNIGTLPEKERQFARDEILNMLRQEMDKMITNRQILFASDTRFIEHIEVKRHNGKLQIEAQSALIPLILTVNCFPHIIAALSITSL